MQEKNLREILEKCSKAELVEVVMKASGMIFTSFSWLTMIAEIRLDEVEAKIEANLAESKELTRKLENIPENRRNFTDSETRQVYIALKKNHDEWKRLNKKYNKFSKELYG